MDGNLYPLKFTPILKDKIWGGHKLKTLLNKKSELSNIGESWEISDVEGDSSIVSKGFLKGKSLTELIQVYREKLVGEKVYKQFKDKFPLLIKFIDAKKPLSIQLHPNDELSAKRHNSFGKTEMWYVMHADEGANLIVGFNDKISPDEYLRHLKSKRLTDILNFENVEVGDTFFIEVGRVHAIGAGVMLAEIQQTSDITYRVYDWDRVDNQGNKRELHNELAIDAINFNMKDDFKVSYNTIKNHSNDMVTCPYFTTHYINLTSAINRVNNKDSFIIYICVEGSAEIFSVGYSDKIIKGETILIPASITEYSIVSENAKLLEVYI